MDTESTRLVLEGLRDVAQRVGTTAEQLWPALVGRAYLAALLQVVLCALLGVAAGLSSAWLLRRGLLAEDWNPDPMFVGAGVLGVLAAVCGFLCVDALPRLLYPETAALAYLADWLS